MGVNLQEITLILVHPSRGRIQTSAIVPRCETRSTERSCELQRPAVSAGVVDFDADGAE